MNFFKKFCFVPLVAAALLLSACGAETEDSQQTPSQALAATYKSGIDEKWQEYCQGLSAGYQDFLTESLQELKDAYQQAAEKDPENVISLPEGFPTEITCASAIEWSVKQPNSSLIKSLRNSNIKDYTIDENDQNKATVNVIAPLDLPSKKAPQPVSQPVPMVKEDGEWKLSNTY